MNLEKLQGAVERARATVSSGELVDVPDGFGSAPRKDYRAGEFTFEGERWVVCTAPMISSSFQLLDATVHQRLERRTNHAVALLGSRPEKDGHGAEAAEAYLSRYQHVAWSALGVAWILDAGDHKGRFVADPDAAAPDRGELATLVEGIERKLAGLRIAPRPQKSRDAEEIIRPRVEEALREMDATFRVDTRKYQGFWRRPEADGVWRRDSGMPLTFGLEVKLDEDMKNPLCQAVELLGRVDAMVYVRVGRPTAKPLPPLAERAKELLERYAPMKYLSVPAE